MSGMGLEYPTDWGCLSLPMSATSLIHFKICLGFFSALSMACTLLPLDTLLSWVNFRSALARSV